ncbi:MAG: electron transfer flavoprotein subunit beta/FixA family protein [Promethearchaeota archaeon]
MNILVCIKQVPEVTEVKLDPVTHTLIREGVPSIVNPFDEIAVEEAIRIKEKLGGEVTIITMGPPQARDALLKCLAMGADKAILITDRAFAGSDTWATSYTLSLAVKKLKYDIIFCGQRAIDGDTAQVGPGLAEHLGIPQISRVKKVEIDPKKKKLIAHRESDEGYEVVEVKLPVLMMALKGLNEPRLPSIMGIMSAKKKEIREMHAEDIGGDSDNFGLKGSPTEVIRTFSPEKKSRGMIIQGEDPDQAAKKLARILIDESIV